MYYHRYYALIAMAVDLEPFKLEVKKFFNSSTVVLLHFTLLPLTGTMTARTGVPSMRKSSKELGL